MNGQNSTFEPDEIQRAVDRAIDAKFDKSNYSSPLYPHLKREIAEKVQAVLDGTIQFESLAHEDPYYVKWVLDELHVNTEGLALPDSKNGQTGIVNAAENNGAAEAEHLLDKGKVTDEVKKPDSSPEKKSTKKTRTLKLPFGKNTRRFMLGAGLALTGGFAVNEVAHCEGAKTEFTLPPEVPNAYKLDLSRPVAEQFAEAVPGLAHQLQVQIDLCTAQLPDTDATKIDLKLFSPTGYLGRIYDEYLDHPEVLARILQEPMPRCVTTDFSSGLLGTAKREKNYVVLDINNPNATKTLVHELNHEMLQKTGEGDVVGEGNTELKTRRMLESGEVDSYEKLTFRAFLMDFLDEEYLEALYQNNSAMTEFDFNKDFKEATTNAEQLISTLVKQVIMARFEKLEPNVTNARMTLYFLAHLMQEGILSVEDESTIYEKQVRPFESNFDKSLVGEYDKLYGQFKEGRLITELPHVFKSITEPLTPEEKAGYDVAHKEAGSISAKEEDERVIPEYVLSALYAVLSLYLFVSFKKTFKGGSLEAKIKKEDEELVETIRHYAQSKKLRQSLLLYTDPALANYVPQSGGSETVEAAKKLIDSMKELGSLQRSINQFSHFAPLFVGLIGSIVNGVSQAETLSNSIAVVTALLTGMTFSAQLRARIFHLFSVILQKVDPELTKLNEQSAPKIQNGYRNHRMREAEIPGIYDLEGNIAESRDKDRIELPLNITEDPVQCTQVRKGLYVVTVMKCTAITLPDGSAKKVHKKPEEYANILVAGPHYDNALPEKYLDRTQYELDYFRSGDRGVSFDFTKPGTAGDHYVSKERIFLAYNEEDPKETYSGPVHLVSSRAEAIAQSTNNEPVFVMPQGCTVAGLIKRDNNVLSVKVVNSAKPEAVFYIIFTFLNPREIPRWDEFVDICPETLAELETTRMEYDIWGGIGDQFVLVIGGVNNGRFNGPVLPFPTGMFKTVPVDKKKSVEDRVASEQNNAVYNGEGRGELKKIGSEDQKMHSVEVKSVSGTEVAGVLGYLRKMIPGKVLFKQGFLKANLKDDVPHRTGRPTTSAESSRGGKESRRYVYGENTAHIDERVYARTDQYFIRNTVDTEVPGRAEIIANVSSLLCRKYYEELFQSLFNAALYYAGRGNAKNAFDEVLIISPEDKNFRTLNYSCKGLHLSDVVPLFERIMDDVQVKTTGEGRGNVATMQLPFKGPFLEVLATGERASTANIHDSFVDESMKLPHAYTLPFNQKRILRAKLIGFEVEPTGNKGSQIDRRRGKGGVVGNQWPPPPPKKGNW